MIDDRDVDVSYDATSFVAELRRLADALENATEFTIRVDGEDVTIPEGALFSIAHEHAHGEIELEFQVTWSLENAADGEGDDNIVEAEAAAE